ncbi:hypothetical protein TcCL_Unassigned04414 [Trypanosoma cruzi]|nr:hypothetical protein TcCL_Unassigned04414 [Trypanosoma cruzi]
MTRKGTVLSSSFCPQQIFPILLLATLWVPRNAVKQSHVYRSPQCAGRGWQPPTLTPSHISSPTTFPHTKGQRNGEEKPAAQRTQKHRHPRRTARRSHAHGTPTAAKRGTERIQVHGTVPYFSLPRQIGITPHSRPWRVASHTHSEARRTPSAPSKYTQQAGASHPPAIAMGTETIVVADHRCL